MRTVCLSFVMGLVCSVVTIGAVQSSKTAEDKVIGMWTGTWDGASTGKYRMLIARDRRRKHSAERCRQCPMKAAAIRPRSSRSS